MTVAMFFTAVLSVALNALAQVALRKAMLGLGALPARLDAALPFAAHLLLNGWFLGGMACYAVSIVVWLGVLSKTPVSLAYPLLSIGYIIAAVVGYFFLGENVTLLRAAGIAVICVGIVLVARSA